MKMPIYLHNNRKRPDGWLVENETRLIEVMAGHILSEYSIPGSTARLAHYTKFNQVYQIFVNGTTGYKKELTFNLG